MDHQVVKRLPDLGEHSTGYPNTRFPILTYQKVFSSHLVSQKMRGVSERYVMAGGPLPSDAMHGELLSRNAL